MEYFEILNDFLNNNKIDSKFIPYIVELFELNRDIVFLGDENRNIKKLYELDNLDIIISERKSFIESEIGKIEKYISELRGLKTVIDSEDIKLIDGIILDKERFKDKIKSELERKNSNDISECKKKMIFCYENNRKNIFLRYSKLKEIKYKFEKNNRVELFHDLEELIQSLKIKTRVEDENSFLILMNKIEEELKQLDEEFLKKMDSHLEIDRFNRAKEQVREKKEALSLLSELFDFNDKYSKPLSDDQNIIKIAMLEHRLSSRDIHVFFEKIKEHPELRPYYEVLNNQFKIIEEDIETVQDQERYLTILFSILNTISSLSPKLIPLKVNKGIFEYRTFDGVKTISKENEDKVVKYESESGNLYSIIEDRLLLIRELDYWKKEMDYGFDRYDKGDFYEEIKNVFNLVKFYYRFRNYIVYCETANKQFDLKDSKIQIDKDKAELKKIEEFVLPIMDSIRLKGIDYWKEEKTPDIYFSKHSDIERKILFDCIVPRDGVGREINSPEMLKMIYGEERVIEIVRSQEKIKGK